MSDLVLQFLTDNIAFVFSKFCRFEINLAYCSFILISAIDRTFFSVDLSDIGLGLGLCFVGLSTELSQHSEFASKFVFFFAIPKMPYRANHPPRWPLGEKMVGGKESKAKASSAHPNLAKLVNCLWGRWMHRRYLRSKFGPQF